MSQLDVPPQDVLDRVRALTAQGHRRQARQVAEEAAVAANRDGRLLAGWVMRSAVVGLLADAREHDEVVGLALEVLEDRTGAPETARRSQLWCHMAVAHHGLGRPAAAAEALSQGLRVSRDLMADSAERSSAEGMVATTASELMLHDLAVEVQAWTDREQWSRRGLALEAYDIDRAMVHFRRALLAEVPSGSVDAASEWRLCGRHARSALATEGPTAGRRAVAVALVVLSQLGEHPGRDVERTVSPQDVLDAAGSPIETATVRAAQALQAIGVGDLAAAGPAVTAAVGFSGKAGEWLLTAHLRSRLASLLADHGLNQRADTERLIAHDLRSEIDWLARTARAAWAVRSVDACA